MEYEINLSANVYNPNNGERFSIIETQTVELETFAQLDELMARMRRAIHPEATNNTHKGIVLRVRGKHFAPGKDILIQADSDVMYLQNLMSRPRQWDDILNVPDSPFAIEIMAADLPNEYPE